MKLVALLLLSSILVCEAMDDCSSFDDLPVKKIRDDPQRLQAFIDCILDKVECYEMDARVKRRSAHIVATGCSDCSEKEKSICRDVSWLTLTTKTSYVPELLRKYDITGNVNNFLDNLTDVPSLLKLPKISGAVHQKYMSEYLANANQ